MNDSVFVDEVRLTGASRRERASGLLGFVTFRLNRCLRIDGASLRRTATGRVALSFPERRDRFGFAHPVVRPLDDRTRSEIEAQIFAALGINAEANG